MGSQKAAGMEDDSLEAESMEQSETHLNDVTDTKRLYAVEDKEMN